MLYAFECMVAIRGGYRMARGWHYTKLSLLSSAAFSYLPVSFSGMCFVLYCSFVFVLFCFDSLVGAFRYSSGIFLSSRPRTTTTTGLATTQQQYQIYDGHG